MSDEAYPVVRCVACNAVVAPTQPACPGCGRCLSCGSIRAKELKQCPKCDLPYCECCGRCPGCLELRYADLGPCDCGHPDDPAKIERLVRYCAVIGAETPPIAWGCVIATIAVALAILGVVGLVVGIPK